MGELSEYSQKPEYGVGGKWLNLVIQFLCKINKFINRPCSNEIGLEKHRTTSGNNLRELSAVHKKGYRQGNVYNSVYNDKKACFSNVILQSAEITCINMNESEKHNF